MQYRELHITEIDRQLFTYFDRYQKVTQCWRMAEGQQVIEDVSFTEQWDEKDYDALVICLKRTIMKSGVVFGAFSDGLLKGFASVDGEFFGSSKVYLDLPCIHVSSDARGCGIGKKLFRMAAKWAKEHGAKKLYVSAHSSVESQAFYHAMGCVNAAEYDAEHIEKEPYDCQLEYDLSRLE